MHHLNKVIYALGLATLLYLAEEAGRKRGEAYERKIIRSIANKNPGKPLDQILNEFEEANKACVKHKHHADDNSVC